MSWPIVINGHTYNESDFAGYGYKTAMPSAFNDVEERVNDAETAATAAAAAAVTALNAPGTQATSTTSLAIGPGTHALQIQTGKAIVPGMEVVIAYTTTPTIRMVGTVISYDAGAGNISVVVAEGACYGSGTYAVWTVSLSAPTGLPDPTGHTGEFLYFTGTTYAFKAMRSGGAVRNAGVALSTLLFADNSSSIPPAFCQLSSTKYLTVYPDSSATYLYAKVVTKNADYTFSAGSANALNAIDSRELSLCPLSETSALVMYRNNSTGYLYAAVLTITGNSVSIGSPAQLTTNGIWSRVVALSASAALATYRDEAASSYPKAVVLSISGTTVTVNTPVTVESVAVGGIVPALAVISSTAALFCWYNASAVGKAVVLSISGTTVTVNTAINVDSGNANTYYFSAALIDASRALVTYSANASPSSFNAVVLSISGTALTSNTPITITTSITPQFQSAVVLDASTAAVLYASVGGITVARNIAVSGTTLTLGDKLDVMRSMFSYANNSAIRNNLWVDGGNVIAGILAYLVPGGQYSPCMLAFAPPTPIALTAASDVVQSINTFLPVSLPDESTLEEGGDRFILKCRGGMFQLKKYDGTALGGVQPGEIASCHLVDAATKEWAIQKSTCLPVTAGEMERTYSGGITGNQIFTVALSATRTLTLFKESSGGTVYSEHMDYSGGSPISSLGSYGTTYTPYGMEALTESLVIFTENANVRAASVSEVGALSIGSATALTGLATWCTIDRLTDTTALITYRGTSNYYYAVVATVNPTTRAVTLGTPVTLSGTDTLNFAPACARLSSTLVLAAWSDSAFGYMRFVPLGISGTTVTAGTAVRFHPLALTWTSYARMVPLDSDSALFVGYNNNSQGLVACVVTTDGIEVAHSEQQHLFGKDINTWGLYQSDMSIVRIDANRVLMVGASSSSVENSTVAMMLYVNGTNITRYGAEVPLPQYGTPNGKPGLAYMACGVAALYQGYSSSYGYRQLLIVNG